jgi:hypothetical protein
VGEDAMDEEAMDQGMHHEDERASDGGLGESPGRDEGFAEFSELLRDHDVPAPSPGFVDQLCGDIALSRVLQGHGTPAPSEGFVGRVSDELALSRVLQQHATPAPSAGFVQSVLDRRARETRDPSPAPIQHSASRPLLWALGIAAAVLIALLPLLLPGESPQGRPELPAGVLDESQAAARFGAQLRSARFTAQGTNPLARTAAMLGEEFLPEAEPELAMEDSRSVGPISPVTYPGISLESGSREELAMGPLAPPELRRAPGARLAIAIPRTYETADAAALETGSLPFELDFEDY